MKILPTLTLSALFLTSCSLTNQDPASQVYQAPPVSLSGSMTPAVSQTETGTVQNPPSMQSVKIWANETKDFPLDMKDNKWALKIDYGTGARVKVHFSSLGTKTLQVNLTTPKDANGNIRVSQIIFPDGTSDGPFWKDMTFDLTKSGSYQVILAPNMMAGDPWSGEVDMSLELK